MSARKPRSFLYDDYMDNTMYADEIPRASRDRRPVRNYTDLDQFDDEQLVSRPRPSGGIKQARSRPADPIYSVDGTVFSVPKPARGGGARTGGVVRKRHPAYALLDDRRPRRMQQRPRVREEIVEVCSTVFHWYDQTSSTVWFPV